jgi:DNA-binding CsgD family transcriptional regulator
MYEPNTGCQLWTGTLRYTKNKSKYGGIYVGRKLCLTHRVAWELKHGPIPKGMCVCHVCDTPLCVNTDHLFLGTRAENNTDRHSKGRTKIPGLRGENAGSAKLTAVQANEVRVAAGKNRDIAAKYGISPKTVWAIKTGITWQQKT